MFESIKTYLGNTLGGSPEAIDMIVLVGIGLVAVATYYVVKGALYMLDSIIRRTPTKWDDQLLNHRMLSGIAQIAPALLINWLLPNFFDDATALHHWVKVLTAFYIVWAVVHIVNVGLGNLYNALTERPAMRSYAVKGVFQMGKLISISIGVIVGLSLLIGKTPLSIITAIGASAAVLMLVFKDTILGLVASVQLTVNKMLHRGDWIVAPKYDVNGEVVDVSLTTVKVRNWDNSISTIPPYSLISDSFRNYQAMRDIKGRLIDRSVLIDINSVRFLTEAEIESLRQRGFLSGFKESDPSLTINISLLRHYLEHYLSELDTVEKSMIYMVRQLEPTPQGLPLQIYFHTPVTEWKAFEHLQSDVMNHVYASVREFGLVMFQSPSGTDLLRAACSASCR